MKSLKLCIARDVKLKKKSAYYELYVLSRSPTRISRTWPCLRSLRSWWTREKVIVHRSKKEIDYLSVMCEKQIKHLTNFINKNISVGEKNSIENNLAQLYCLYNEIKNLLLLKFRVFGRFVVAGGWGGGQRRRVRIRLGFSIIAV